MLAPRAGLGRGAWVAMVVGPVAIVLLSLAGAGLPGLGGAVRDAWPAMLVAGLLYAASHVLRATRLVILAAPALGMPVRTVALLHFHTAPVSFIVPFKLGELYRWQQLAWLSRSPVGSLLILLLDRMLDAVVLLAVLAGLAWVGAPLPLNATLLSLVLAAATVLGLFAVLVLPGCLATAQAYVLQHHSAPRARWTLRALDAMRLMTGTASHRLRRNAVPLLFLSAGVWALESAMLLVLAWQLGPEGHAGLSLLGVTLFPQAAGPAMAVMGLYALVCLVTLLVIWPFATALYLRRIGVSRRGVAAAARPLSALRRRRIHLHPGRYSL